MKRFAIAMLCGVAGYVVVAIVSYFLVLELSSNVHDREVEAAMSAAFFFGPVGAIIAFVAGLIRSGRRPDAMPKV
ncbi:MAG TPA: hypothetical protein VGA51_05585 [Casimicrobiaceae bacterium]